MVNGSLVQFYTILYYLQLKVLLLSVTYVACARKKDLVKKVLSY